MALFKRKESWERMFRLMSNQSSGRSILAVLFWLWGIVGLLLNAGTLFGLPGNIGVGTSAYLTATCLVWIGGMVLFGVGALLARTDFDGERPMEADYGDVRVTRYVVLPNDRPHHSVCRLIGVYCCRRPMAVGIAH